MAQATLTSSEPSNWELAVRALRSRNYRLFFGGQSLSLIGTWMSRVATSWLVYRLTDSALLLGVAGFASQIPAFFLAPVAGVWIDRMDRHRTLLVTQFVSMLQSLAMGGLILVNAINIWWILALALVQGAINAFDMPARQAFVIEMIEDRADLSNAIALNSSMVNGSRLVGPAVAGVLIAGVGEAYCFLIDGVSYLAVIASLMAMRIQPFVSPAKNQNVAQELSEGWHYVIESPAIRTILLLLAIGGLVAMPFSVLMPVIAGSVLHGGPHLLGYLTGASGVGAFASAVSLALRKSVVGLGRRISNATALLGVGLIVFGLSRHPVLSAIAMVAVGFGLMQQMAACNTILQTIVSDDKRGRVMSFYTLSILGVTPFGSLLAGALANRIGAPATLAAGGVISLLAALVFARRLPALRREIRPIYVKLGIIPELATGVQSASALQVPPEG